MVTPWPWYDAAMEIAGRFGVPVAAMAYWMLRDWKFTTKLVAALAVIEEYVRCEERRRKVG